MSENVLNTIGDNQQETKNETVQQNSENTEIRFLIVEFSSNFLVNFLNNLKKLLQLRVKQTFFTPKTELIEKIKFPSSKMA